MEKTIQTGQDYYHRPYRWFMLILIALVQVSTNFCNIQISAAAATVIEQLGLTTAQFGAVSSCSFLGGAILGFICGPLGDRYGVKNVITATGALSILGCAWRLFADTFFTLFASMFIIGVVMAALNANSAKIINMWFSPTQAGFAMSVYIACSTLGAVLALSSTPALMLNGVSMRGIYTVGLVVVVIAIVLWAIFARNKPEGAPTIKEEPVIKYLKNVIGHGHLWLNSIAMFCMMGAFITCSSFMVLATTTYKGLSPAEAGALSSISAIVAVPLMLIIPAAITKSGYMKAGTIGCLLIGAGILALSWSMKSFGVGTMALFIIGISLIGNCIPLMKQWPAYLPGIPQNSIGAAGGIQATMQNLGAFLVPSYILGAIVGENVNIIYFGVAIVACISAVMMLFVPDIGTKAQAKRAAEAE